MAAAAQTRTAAVEGGADCCGGGADGHAWGESDGHCGTGADGHGGEEADGGGGGANCGGGGAGSVAGQARPPTAPWEAANRRPAPVTASPQAGRQARVRVR